ncbi:MAG: DUF2478 domain-containing protein [Granulosicoccaceae bacterium]
MSLSQAARTNTSQITDALLSKKQMQKYVVVPKIAAIIASETNQADSTLANLTTELGDIGYNIAGVLQSPSPQATNRCNAELFCIGTGEKYTISQDLGSCSISCSLDVEALENIALKLRDSISDDTDLVIINRFGKRECSDGGFCCVIERAVELGIPVLTVVNTHFIEAWLDYGGQQVTIIENDQQQLSHWAHAVLPSIRLIAAP